MRLFFRSAALLLLAGFLGVWLLGLLSGDVPVEVLEVLVFGIYAVLLLEGLIDFAVVVVVLLDVIEEFVFLS